MTKSRRTLIDPIPCFMQFWTNAINVVQNAEMYNKNSEVIEGNIFKIFQLGITNNEGHTLDYGSTQYCLVGEAHGFGKEYDDGVTQCSYCCRACSNPARQAAQFGGDKLIKFKIMMYNHMIQQHGMIGNKIDIKKVPKIQDMVC